MGYLDYFFTIIEAVHALALFSAKILAMVAVLTLVPRALG
jgi:hypothetical protein